MMFNLSKTDLIDVLNNTSIQFNRYFTIIIFLFGTIGNLLNCLVLSQPTLRSNPCAFLFLISSIVNTISIIFGLTTRILSGWHLDITDTNSFACKFRAFVMFVSRTIAFWLIAYATVDRWYSSCFQYHRRQRSSLKNSQRGTLLIIIFSILLYSQVIYCYDANLSSTPLHCYATTIQCRLVTDLIYTLITILCPLLMMSIFGFLTISNMRQRYSVQSSRKKCIDLNENSIEMLRSLNIRRQRWKKIDRYLRHVLFIQIIFLTFLTMPQAIEKFYTTLTINTNKSLLHLSIDKFMYNFVLLLSYVASGIPFYIYTLSRGNVFRTTLMNLFKLHHV